MTITTAEASNKLIDQPVTANGLTKRFGRLVAIDNLNFSVPAGQVTGFLGSNGAGKTTALRLMAGLTRPTSGNVKLFGLAAADAAARVRLGYMPADPCFLPHLTGRENLHLLALLRRANSVTDSATACHELELTDAELDRPVSGYSSGMRQKLAIVAAIQHHPDLVILDEPANRLDPIAHERFCRLMRAIADDGRAVLLSSHVISEVETLCDQVILLRNGRILEVAGVADLRRGATRRVTMTYNRRLDHAPPTLSDASISGAVVTGRIPAGRPDIVEELARDPGVVDITVTPASLEETFLQLYSAPTS